ncbi:Fc.00g039400.m01.CDS01 [Cosmosporella sp. VM-42]
MNTAIALREYSYGRLGLIAISKLAWLPRLSFSHLTEWLLEDPQQRLDFSAAQVIALGTPGNRVLPGRISHVANAIHPLTSFKKSTFTAIHIQKVPRTAGTSINDADAGQHQNEVPSLTPVMKATVITGFLIFIASFCAALAYGDFQAAFILLAFGSSSSLSCYMTRWQASQVDVSGTAVHDRKKGDIMIYTRNGAFLLVTCSTEVAEELYFKFSSFTRGFKAFETVRRIGFGAMVGLYWGIFSCIQRCSYEGQLIVYYSFLIANVADVAFGLMPSDWRWDLSQYYWADVSPKMPEKRVQAAKEQDFEVPEPTPEVEKAPKQPDSPLDLGFANMLLLGIVKSREASWILSLNLIPTMKIREARAALKLAPILLDPRMRRKLLSRANNGRKYTPEDESFSSKYLRQIIASITPISKPEGRQTPDPSTYHINSRSRELGSVVPDILKLLIEACTGRSLSWYPLSDLEGVIADSHVRVYSLDPDNRGKPRFYHDLPKSLAEALFSFPFASAAGTNHAQWWLLGRPRVFLHGASIIQVLLDYYAIDTAEGITSPASPLGQPKTGGSSQLDEHGAGPAPPDSPTADTKPSSTTSDRGDSEGVAAVSATIPPNQSEESDETTLFLCADVAAHDSRAQAAKLGMTDRATIDKLRWVYGNLSSKWPGVKRITGVSFFRFHSFLQRQVGKDLQMLVHIHKDKQRYPLETDPEYSEYRYSPRPWPASLPFPAREICWYFLHPQDCGTSSALNEMLPVRVRSGLATHRRAFGIYIEQRYSVWAIFVPVVVLSAMLLGATLWFVKSHTDDLQTAIVPFTVASSIATLVVNVAVSLLLFRMLAP